MDNNIGFRQYKLSEDFSMDAALGHKITNNGFEVDENYPLSNAVDGNDTTYAKINGTQANSLIINFNNNIHCNYVKIVFHNEIQRISMFDHNGQLIFRKVSYSGSFSIAEGELDKNISSVTLTFNPVASSSVIEISSIELFSDNTIVPPAGYYIKDIEVQSKKVEGGEVNGN